MALLQVEADRPVEARATLGPLASRNFAELPQGAGRIFAVAASAWVAASLGERMWAQLLEPMLRPHVGLAVQSGAAWWGPVDRYVALLFGTLDRLDEADKHFSAASELTLKMGSPPWLARTQVEWAELLERRGRAGDSDQAKTLRADATATAERLGLAGIERRARR